VKRPEVLNVAKRAVTTDREADHGKPEDTFDLIARFWSLYTGSVFTPVDVAMMMTLLKIARQRGNPQFEDNYVDISGYSACAAELAEIWSKPSGGTD
jgi:Domain of unknown function (DUF6378)